MTATLPAPVAERGVLTISEQAVERLAACAVLEVDDVGGAGGRGLRGPRRGAGRGPTAQGGARGVLGVSLSGEDLDHSAKVSARVGDETVTLDVRISIVYPASVARTTEKAREHLVERVEALTGLTVTRVDLTVTALHTTAGQVRRVE